MHFENVSTTDLQEYDRRLFVPAEATNVMLWINEDDEAIGYVSTEGNYLEAIEIFEEYQGQGHGLVLLTAIVEVMSTEHFVIKLNPIEEWLIDYYKSFGFSTTSSYYDEFAEFPEMEMYV
jgi:GNAT superfamily N-acetyltransferase